MAELAEPRGQDFVTGGERIAERRFPSTRAGGRENENLPLGGLKNFLQIPKQWKRKLGEFGRPMVFHRHHHGAGDAVRDIGWPWYKKKVAARHNKSSICLPGYIINKTTGSSATA